MNNGHLPLTDGHLLSEEDVMLRKNILELMCMNETTLNKAALEASFVEAANKNYWPWPTMR